MLGPERASQQRVRRNGHDPEKEHCVLRGAGLDVGGGGGETPKLQGVTGGLGDHHSGVGRCVQASKLPTALAEILGWAFLGKSLGAAGAERQLPHFFF